MRGVLRAVRIAGRTAAAVLVALVVLYGAVLAVNVHDRPASSAARQAAGLLDGLPEVADGENAFVYMLGFAAPRDADPRRTGAERADWIRRLRAEPELGRDSDPYPGGMSDVWDPHELFRRCPSRHEQRECFAILTAAGADVEGWLAEQQWVLDRYERLTGHSRWRDIRTFYTGGLSRTLSSVRSARRAWFLEAWARARRGDAAGVREALGADLELWRLVLAETSSLLTKSIAASNVANHFERSNVILKALPAASAGRAVPASWREPISAAERSLRRALAPELRLLSEHLDDLTSSSVNRPAGSAGAAPRRRPLIDRLGDGLARPLLKRQDYVNKAACRFDAVASAAVAPYGRLPQALNAARTPQCPLAAHWAEPLYNPFGDWLRSVAADDWYTDAAARLGDLEGVRRAALLTVDLRRRGVEAGDVEAALDNAAFEHPYTGGPFAWDADDGAVVFVGLSSRRRGRHAIWY